MKVEDLPDKIREYAAQGRKGCFVCLNPHWVVYLLSHEFCLEYFDDPDIDDYRYENWYKSAEELIEAESVVFSDGDDWVWEESEE